MSCRQACAKCSTHSALTSITQRLSLKGCIATFLTFIQFIKELLLIVQICYLFHDAVLGKDNNNFSLIIYFLNFTYLKLKIDSTDFRYFILFLYPLSV